MGWMRSGWVGGFLIGVLFNAAALVVFHSGSGGGEGVSLSLSSWTLLRTSRAAKVKQQVQPHLNVSQKRALYESTWEDETYEEEMEELEFGTMFVTNIVLCLIALTIAFEWGKHRLEESVTDDMEPIIEKLFGEMTVLGFLSMVSFILHAAGFFKFLSRLFFGSDNEQEELVEVFEWVHFSIFFIMVFFFIQVIVLIRQAIQTERQWLELDKDYRRPESEQAKPESMANRSFLNRMWTKFRHSNGYISLLPFFRSQKTEQDVGRAFFKALRDEFILDRSMDPPFEPVPEGQRLKYDFVFGRYLGLCLVRFLARVVDVTNTTLILLAIGTVLFFAWSKLIHEDPILLSWSWLLVGWFHFLFNVYFEKHILQIRHELVPEGSPHLVTLYDTRTQEQLESAGFKSMSEKDISLPGWCSVNLEQYMIRRGWIKRMFAGAKPNRQDTLYWMDRLGPTIYLILLQSNMIFIGVDFALQLVFCIPTMHKFTSPAVFVIYCVLVVLSLSGNLLNKKHLVANVAVICSVGCHRNIPAIADVFREEKTENLVRCFLIIYRLRIFAFDVKMDPKPLSSDDCKHYEKMLDPLEILEVSKTFECFARDDGCIYSKEFSDLMATLGGEISEENLKNMMATMDVDSDGMVKKEEFLQWYADNMVDHEDNALNNAPRVLFQLFDQDNQGELSVSQFKAKLDALRVGFTVDEQIAIINEIDRNGSGSITQHEFEVLFKKFPPTELLRNETQFEYRPGELLCNIAGCNAFA